ncbi:MAG: lamin tail domain-containing protein [Verrucomicrobiota bacterium]
MNLRSLSGWVGLVLPLFGIQASAANLVHHYPFTVDASDTLGGANGQLEGGAAISGGAVVFNGSSAYVNLPVNLVSNLTSVTFEAWYTDYGSSTWARIYDMGNSTGGEGNQGGGINYMFLTALNPSGGIRGGYNDGSAEEDLDISPRPALGLEHHLVWTQDGSAQVASLYVDGKLMGQNTSFTFTPAAIGATENDWLGRSQYDDPYFYGTIDDFRIYDGALNSLQIAINLAAGPNQVVTNSGPLESIGFQAATTMAQGASQVPAIVGNFQNVTNVNLLAQGVQFVSGNTNVVTVNSAGVITAVGPGVATVTASYAGMTGAQAIYVSDPPQTLVHRYSFTSDASDSEGGANGTLAGGATISGGAAVFNGSSAYVNLPVNLVSNLASITYEAWFTDYGSSTWGRIYDFGNSVDGEGGQGGGTSYMYLTALSSSGGIRGAYNEGSGEEILDVGTRPTVGVEHHIVWAQDANAQVASLYVDGALVGENTSFTFTPAAIGATENDWLGRSQYNDPYFYGSIDEFRIYSAALSAAQVAQNYHLGPNVSPQSGPVTVTAQPASLTVTEQQPATFRVGYIGRHPVAFQWYRNATPLAGATNSVYELLTASLTNSGATFYVAMTNTVTNTVFTALSSNAVLTVLPDTNPPVVVRVINVGVTNVEIVYSKLVAAAGATNTANYVFTNGLPVIQAVLNSDNVTVILTTAPLTYGSNYWLLINGVQDRATMPNTIATNTLVMFTPLAITPQDLGSPAVASTVAVAGDGYNITALGTGFGGNLDQGNFSYQIYTGDFDVCVRVAGVGLSDIFASAGLMAREDLTVGGRYAAAMATPAMNGCFFAWRDPIGSAASSAGSFPANYPDTWLRLSRSGGTFSGFASYDGQSWTQLGSDSISMPSQIYLGFATSSENAGAATTAQFRDFGNVTNAMVAVVPVPHEMIGPSSRLTPITFSEIMWKPAPRTDGKNLEFLELYNANPWFQNIGGYQLICADMNYTFPAGTQIPGGGYLVVAAAPADIESVYGITNVMGPYDGSLKHSETLELLDEQTNVLLTVPYTDAYPWPVATDGTGHSLVLANPTYGEGDPRAWDISDVVGGSPGQMDGFTPSPLRNVVINEILPHSENPAVPQFIELYNHATNRVDVSGCILTDDPTTNKFVIPSGTIIGPAGFVSFTQPQFGFTLNGGGETLYFIKPDGSRVLDAVQFGAQADGVSYGRWPDGANDFYAFTTNTPGTNNSAIFIGGIVINELMYDPISGNDDGQYIELYNQGTNTVNLAGWQLSSAVTFTFPSVNLAPNGYLVVAKNLTNLLAAYTNLNNGNTVGNYSGKLSHDGELLILSQPETLYTNTPILVAEDQVAYGTGGRWGEWSGGGGSSLELIDPRANHRLAANWADSDDTQKSSWVDIENTAVLDNGQNYDASIDYAQMGLLDSGECLVDNIEVDYNGSNYVSNGTFEGALGLTHWSMQGCLARSSLDGPGYQSASCLHMRCSDRVWTGDNSCQVALNANTMAAGATVTLRYKARWLHGWPEPLLRLNGNWLEATAAMPVPSNLGSPGLPNSRYVTNAGPAIYNVTHNPTIPAAGLPVVVSAQVHDPDGVQNLTLCYRLDPATNYSSVPMVDNGAGGDAIAKDGIFSATIPGQAANQVVAFYLSATDRLGAATRFPALRPQDNEPVRECVVMFGDGNPAGSFGVYHLWLTQTNVNRWSNLSDLSNEGNDCTFVNGKRVIYNLQGRFAGSPYHQEFNTPTGNLCHYKWEFNDDDKFLGATDFNKIHQPGNSPGDDGSLQREQLANTFLRALGVPWLNKRYVVVYVNGNRRGELMEDTQVPGSDMVKEHYPNDDDGFLFKMQPWFEMAPQPSGATMAFNNNAFCQLNSYTTTGGVKKPARYRYNFEIRRTPDSGTDFTNVFSLVDAANSSGSPNFVANLENIANMENWMRVFAANHAAGNWDSFGAANAQNLYGYIGALGTKYSLLMWDFNIVIGNSGSWGPGEDLFTYNTGDSGMVAIYNNPTFLRMYWRALQELVNGPLNVADSGPLVEAKYNVFTGNGLSVEDPAVNIEPWLAQAQTSIAAQLAVVNATNFSVNPTVVVSNNLAYVTGTAPVNVATVWINGVAYPLTWTTLTNWVVVVPLQTGTNQLRVTGIDHTGQLIAGDTNSVSVVFNATNASPVGQVVINEIMYAPLVNNAEYVELYNNSTNTSYDLSGWQFQGLDYTFPPGSLLAPTNYLLLAANGAAFAAEFGATNPVFDTFSGTLPPGGEMLTLSTASNEVVARVEYENQAPWPTTANGTGASLQLVDSHQDNWRVGNWTAVFTNAPVTPEWTYVTATGTASTSLIYIYLQSAGDVYVDDLELVAGMAAGSGVNKVADGGFESGFPGPWTVSANLTSSTLSTTIKHSGNASLHVISSAAGTTQSSAIWQIMSPALTTNATYTLSFWYLQSTNGGPLTIRLSGSGTVATVNPAPPAGLAPNTPAAPNSVAASLAPFPTLWINEVQADNLTGITNSAGQHVDWLELYNGGANACSLAGLYLANNYTNLLQWAFPTNVSVGAEQFKVIFADGLTNLSTTNELHASFVLPSGTGSLALTRLATNGQQQVLDYVDYGNIGLNDSYGSYPDGQSFYRQEFYQATPGASNNATATAPPSFIDYAVPASVYTQNFDSLPDPGAASVNTANPVTIDGVTYSLANPYDFAGPVLAAGAGGLGLPALAGWYGSGVLLARFGATDGDQTTGGQISFGPEGGSNRALGLLATSSTGATAFGARFVNGTGITLTRMNLQFTGELWRQSNLPKTLQFYYYVDLTGTSPLATNTTAFIPALNLSFPTAAADTGGVAVDGTSAPNQTNLSVANQAITNWPPGAALWLVWQMTDSTGKAQGLGIDNLSFSASVPVSVPLVIQPAGTNLLVTWPGLAGQTYQLEYSDDLASPSWTPVGNPVTGVGTTLYTTNNFGNSPQRFFRLRLVN